MDHVKIERAYQHYLFYKDSSISIDKISSICYNIGKLRDK